MTFTPLVLTDTKIYYSSLDASGYSNHLETATSVDDEEVTTFSSGGYKARVGGVFDTTTTATMFWQAGDLSQPDDVLFNNLGTSTQPLSLIPTGGVVGDLAYLTKVLDSSIKPGADHGKVLTTDANWLGEQPMARGQVFHPNGTARTATGNGTGIQLGAVSATQRFYSNLHVLGYTDGSMTVKIQSSVDNTFASPTDRIIFTASTALSGQSSNVLGAVTDTWWRATWTISGGSTHSFLFAVTCGIAVK